MGNRSLMSKLTQICHGNFDDMRNLLISRIAHISKTIRDRAKLSPLLEVIFFEVLQAESQFCVIFVCVLISSFSCYFCQI